MQTKLVDNTSEVLQKKKLWANRFLNNFAEDVIRRATPKTPKLSGDLRGVNKSVQGVNASLKWSFPYAQYQERGMRADGSHVVRKYTTPGTGPRFAENAVKDANSSVGGIVSATGGL